MISRAAGQQAEIIVHIRHDTGRHRRSRHRISGYSREIELIYVI